MTSFMKLSQTTKEAVAASMAAMPLALEALRIEVFPQNLRWILMERSLARL
jgi:hypothetical protein